MKARDWSPYQPPRDGTRVPLTGAGPPRRRVKRSFLKFTRTRGDVVSNPELWLPALATGLAFAALGIVPRILPVTGRPLRIASSVLLVCATLAVVAATHFGAPHLSTLESATAENSSSTLGTATAPEG